jgi:hypothetical protein
MIAVVLFTLLTALCWGVYGPVLHNGQHDMGVEIDGKHVDSLLRPFICVGLAYFLIAVLVPLSLLKSRGEVGAWTVTGTIWSLVAGAAGALGALGIILAFGFGGNPVYVMPLVFGGAPVVNTFTTMYLTKTTKQAGPMFFAGLILVIAGAVAVLFFKPPAPGGKKELFEMEFLDMAMVIGSIVLTMFSWGVYGPVLHKGQMAMQGSRLRPLTCVGLAYFLIAVLVPAALLLGWKEPGEFTFSGSLWSLAGGAAGAIGALGIIMAFTFGGKPIYVMPLVFGLAPVINTFTSLITKGNWDKVGVPFYAGLIIVIAGAVTVLLFAPKAAPHAAAKK